MGIVRTDDERVYKNAHLATFCIVFFLDS